MLQAFPSSFQLVHERLKLGIVSDPVKARVTGKERIIGHAFADAHSQPLHGLRGVSRERENSGDSGTARSEKPPQSGFYVNLRVATGRARDQITVFNNNTGAGKFAVKEVLMLLSGSACNKSKNSSEKG